MSDGTGGIGENERRLHEMFNSGDWGIGYHNCLDGKPGKIYVDLRNMGLPTPDEDEKHVVLFRRDGSGWERVETYSFGELPVEHQADLLLGGIQKYNKKHKLDSALPNMNEG